MKYISFKYLNYSFQLAVMAMFISMPGMSSGVDSLKQKHPFEISFGQSLIFISNSKQINIRNQQAIVIPTSALLFFGELFPQKKLRIPMFINIPTETKQFLVNGVLINERASPTIGTGVTLRCFNVAIDKISRFEMEVGPLVSVIFDSRNNIRLAPIIGSRFKISRGDNFIMYCGLSYSIGINALGLIYGTGTQF